MRPDSAIFHLCCANHFLHNQTAMDLGTEERRERAQRTHKEGIHSGFLFCVSSPVKAGEPMKARTQWDSTGAKALTPGGTSVTIKRGDSLLPGSNCPIVLVTVFKCNQSP